MRTNAFFMSSIKSGLPPVNTVLPAVTGTAEVGEVLTASTGTWDNSPTSYAYQWKRDGVNISGATSSMYTLTVDDYIHQVSVTVTATNLIGSENASSSPSDVRNKYLGVLQSETFANTTNWTLGGSSLTLTPTTGGATLAGGVSGGYENYFYHNYSAFSGHKWKIRAPFKVVTPDTASAGFCVGIFNRQNANTRNIILMYRPSNNTMFIIRREQTSTNVAISQVVTAPAATDELEITLERNFFTYQAVFKNLTTGYITSMSTEEPTTRGNNTGYFGIQSHGNSGVYLVHGVEISSDCSKNVDTVFIGDSITNGYNLSKEQRYSSQLFKNATDSIEIWAGGGDVTLATVNSMPYLLLMNPKKAVLMQGGNDIEDGTPDATRESRYTSIASSLRSNGTTVVHCLPTARTTSDMRPHKTFIETNPTFIANDQIVDTWTPTWDSATSFNLKVIYDSGDGRHPNAAGNVAMAAGILSGYAGVIRETNSRNEYTNYIGHYLHGLKQSEMTLLNTMILNIGSAQWAGVKDLLFPGISGSRGLRGLKGYYKLTNYGSPTLDKTGVSYNGTNQFGLLSLSILTNMLAVQNNAFMGVFIKTIGSTTGTVMGSVNASGNGVQLKQDTVNGTTYKIHQTLNSILAAELAMSQNLMYVMNRSGATTSGLLKSAVSAHSSSVTSTALATGPDLALGGHNSNMVVSDLQNVKIAAWIYGANSIVTHSTINTEITTVVDALAA